MLWGPGAAVASGTIGIGTRSQCLPLNRRAYAAGMCPLVTEPNAHASERLKASAEVIVEPSASRRRVGRDDAFADCGVINGTRYGPAQDHRESARRACQCSRPGHLPYAGCPGRD
jgi:hypothetical protein